MPSSAPAESSKAPKAAAASLIGTTIEYYDFAVHGTASALVLGPAFLPSGNATVSSLAAFLTFAAAFLSRPLGVVRFGTIGDRPGRRQAWSRPSRSSASRRSASACSRPTRAPDSSSRPSR
ncbi:hypothetical protein [Streptomyces europaeiscabiei]|uniref:hypothetical protein n=1 Tax=Streptomyces europaeiscabiei TaxID=146819 RepID=UPI0038D35593